MRVVLVHVHGSVCGLLVQLLTMREDNTTEGYLTSDYALHLRALPWRKPFAYKKASGMPLELIRSVENERSVFIGCLPGGDDNMEEVLQGLMETFLGRFDFAPSNLGRVRGVKIMKDYAFVEFALDGVAQIVLAANQIDAFDWVVRGVLFNIEGCKGTYTSVRPLVEFMPLKPARIILIGNIPKRHWDEEYLKTYFCKLIQGSDETLDMKVVVAVYLLPESLDAYLELASEFVADAVFYKCSKNSDVLKAIGDDTYICRHTKLIPLMSKHTSSICPQKALFVGLSYGGEKFKIECIRKIFEEVLLTISRRSNYHGFIEYISVQPGTDYAFFQFDSEAIVDAMMDEYIENTPFFFGGTGLAYIILRPPHYVRPGAKYRCDIRQVQFALSHQHELNAAHSNQACWMQTEERNINAMKHKHDAKDMGIKSTEYMNRPVPYIKPGNDARRKADVVMSVSNTAPQPCEDWQGRRSSAIGCPFDSESVIIVEGLIRGLNFKLLRGALNELFERALSSSGLLQIGKHIVKYLDRDPETGRVIACLPNAEFAEALLSARMKFILAGKELRLLSSDPRKAFYRKPNTLSLGNHEGEMSYFDDGRDQGRAFRRGMPVEERRIRQNRRLHTEFSGQYPFDHDAPEREVNSFSRRPISRRSDSPERSELTPPKRRFRREVDSEYSSASEMPERDVSIASKQTDLSMPEPYERRDLRSASSESLETEFKGQYREHMQERNYARRQVSDSRVSCRINAKRIRRHDDISGDGAVEHTKGGSRIFNQATSYIPARNNNMGGNSERFYLEENERNFSTSGKNSRSRNLHFSGGSRSRSSSVERVHDSQRLRSQVVRDRLVKNLQPGADRHRICYVSDDDEMFINNQSYCTGR